MFDEVIDHFDWLADLCHKAEGAERALMWGNELVFSVNDALFCLFRLDARKKVAVSFRPHPDLREQVLEHPAVEPAAFPADGDWVYLPEEALASPSHPHYIPRETISDWVRHSYELARAEEA